MIGAGLAAALGLAACAPVSDADPMTHRSATLSVPILSLGRGTTCATVLDQSKCWGQAAAGRLGAGVALGSRHDEPGTLDFIDLGSGVQSLASNGAQTFAVLDDGTVRAFGANDEGQLGLGHTQTIGDDQTPAQAGLDSVVSLSGPATHVVAGEDFACALLDDGAVQCWGSGDLGQLGRGIQPGVQPPADVVLGAPAIALTAGSGHACALLDGGAVRCWGRDDAGQRGYGNSANNSAFGELPSEAGDVPLGAPALEIAAGGDHTCARLNTGTLRCWGSNADGQLGLGHAEAIGDDEPALAAAPVPLGAPVISVTAGRRHTCALLDDDTVRCWGASEHGQRGEVDSPLGDDESALAAPAVDFGDAIAIAVTSGALADHTCAVLDDQSTRCWGLNDYGQLGLGFVDAQDPVEGPPGDLPDVIIVDDSEL